MQQLGPETEVMHTVGKSVAAAHVDHLFAVAENKKRREQLLECDTISLCYGRVVGQRSLLLIICETLVLPAKDVAGFEHRLGNQLAEKTEPQAVPKPGPEPEPVAAC